MYILLSNSSLSKSPIVAAGGFLIPTSTSMPKADGGVAHVAQLTSLHPISLWIMRVFRPRETEIVKFNPIELSNHQL
jgi:hypothetical protein